MLVTVTKIQVRYYPINYVFYNAYTIIYIRELLFINAVFKVNIVSQG